MMKYREGIVTHNYNYWILIFHLLKMLAVLIRPNHLCCCLKIMLSMLIT